MSHGKFDLTVHHRNSKTGRITNVTPYKLHIVNGAYKYERPPGSGKFYSGDGEPLFKEEAVQEPVVADAAAVEILKEAPKVESKYTKGK